MSRPEYSSWSHAVTRLSNASDTGMNLAATAALWAGYAVHSPIALNRISFLVTTQTTSGSVTAQVAFVRYPVQASTGSVALGTLTIPNAATVGQVYYKDIAYVKLNAGDELAIWCSRQCVDAGTAAGVGFPGFQFDPAPDSVGNQSNMVASA